MKARALEVDRTLMPGESVDSHCLLMLQGRASAVCAKQSGLHQSQLPDGVAPDSGHPAATSGNSALKTASTWMASSGANTVTTCQSSS